MKLRDAGHGELKRDRSANLRDGLRSLCAGLCTAAVAALAQGVGFGAFVALVTLPLFAVVGLLRHVP